MATNFTSKRLAQLPISAIRKLVPYAQDAKSRGITVYHLNIGDPDIKTPDVMLEKLRSWKANPIGYTLSCGTAEFISALLAYYHKIGYTFIDKTDLIATIGGSEALSMAFFATCQAGDEVLVFEPFYSNYAVLAALNGVTLKAIPTEIKTGFHLPKASKIEKAITAKTRAILFSNPANPTGTVYTEKEIRMLVSIAKKHQLFLIADEVYREFIFVNRPHASLLPYFKKIPQLAIVLDSLSKRYSLCGARLGVFLTKNKDIIAGITKIAMGRLSAGMIDQAVGAALTDVPQKYFDQVQKEYKKRRDILFSGLKSIPGVTIAEPEGAFYAIVGLPVKNAEKFCIWLLQEFSDNTETVMFAPGAGFYSTAGKGSNEVRIAYVLAGEKIIRSIEILKKALKVYKN